MFVTRKSLTAIVMVLSDYMDNVCRIVPLNWPGGSTLQQGAGSRGEVYYGGATRYLDRRVAFRPMMKQKLSGPLLCDS